MGEYLANDKVAEEGNLGNMVECELLELPSVQRGHFNGLTVADGHHPGGRKDAVLLGGLPYITSCDNVSCTPHPLLWDHNHVVRICLDALSIVNARLTKKTDAHRHS